MLKGGVFINQTTSLVINNYYSIKQFTEDYYRLTFHKYNVKQSGYEKPDENINEWEYVNLTSLENIEANNQFYDYKLDNSLSRSKSKIFEYALCNEFDYFVTLTIDDKKQSRYNLADYIKKLTRFIRYMRDKYNTNIQYLLIPEMHKNGAWHLHGLLKGVTNDMLEINKNGYLDWKEYSDRFGYMSLGKIKSQIAVSKYITKYVSKDLGQGIEREKNMYYVSRGLKQAKKTHEGKLPDHVLNSIKFEFENDYVCILTLNKKEYKKLTENIENS